MKEQSLFILLICLIFSFSSQASLPSANTTIDVNKIDFSTFSKNPFISNHNAKKEVILKIQSTTKNPKQFKSQEQLALLYAGNHRFTESLKQAYFWSYIVTQRVKTENLPYSNQQSQKLEKRLKWKILNRNRGGENILKRLQKSANSCIKSNYQSCWKANLKPLNKKKPNLQVKK